MQPDAVKVLIYAVRDGHLLVFDEPDFPDVQLQVPGGTVESGEDIVAAAGREFEAETGFAPRELHPLGVQDYRFEKNGRDYYHQRHYFRCGISERAPATWLHHEMTPFDGGDPIGFRFFWLPIETASKRLGHGMEALIEHL
ncbi:MULTISPECIES: NUDIX hydrolase [Rhizobium]|uniref:8-oxo-dGTP pyrophosphatase MutT (NUDIX family) n=1 Tax=Rhizobium tropici TaxID=398 RepID=A0A6P1C2G0_RHITR|nr:MULTISPECIES: NUDIX domain-containing protein [Rhizobium]AGB72936.1 nudix hydrolase [Rhizobium tropici CIAT 899]MBB4241236.1 8-oxo-dGTP pyrophosphatase MutT (NUDIX family) [Rhizobium tropici]MBB5592218.1 8-oxo-dGTP pyrophosphatase MutT (NUDIX family) [Rhizobium tropici]MBB6491561.1 8-oxo-dGTP pyrophosphatase MutT (NUDIX family) [Rhizobium tropici]NEV10392.1 NUDIX domain-containing protein [Rhizobium tropici]